MKVSFNHYIKKNKFKKNVNSALKYLRRYDIKKFNIKIQRFCEVKGNNKSVSKKQPYYNYQKK